MIAGRSLRETDVNGQRILGVAVLDKTPQMVNTLGECGVCSCLNGDKAEVSGNKAEVSGNVEVINRSLTMRVCKLENDLCNLLKIVERSCGNGNKRSCVKRSTKSRKCYRCGKGSHIARDCRQKYDVRKVKEKLRNSVDVMLLDVVVADVMQDLYVMLEENRQEVLRVLKSCSLDSVVNLKMLNRISSERQSVGAKESVVVGMVGDNTHMHRGDQTDSKSMYKHQTDRNSPRNQISRLYSKNAPKHSVKISGVTKYDTRQNSGASRHHLQEHHADLSPSHTQTQYCSPSTSEQCQFVNFCFVDNRWKSPPYPPSHHPGFEYVDLVI